MLQKYLNKEFNAIEYNPASSGCGKNEINKMTLMHAWKECVGIPDFMFVDRSFVPNFKPRPIKFHLSKLRFKSFDLDKVHAKCSSGECYINITIEKIIVSSDINIVLSDTYNQLKANDKIVNIEDFQIKIGKNKFDRKPVLRIHIIYDLSKKNPHVLLDQKKSFIYFPKESFSVKIKDHKERFSLVRLLNNGIVFLNKSLISYSLNYFNETRYVTFMKIMNLDKSINENLHDPLNQGRINSLMNEWFLAETIKQLNKNMEDEIYNFSFLDLLFPGVRWMNRTSLNMISNWLQVLVDQRILDAED
jgi:hypothetical protein